MLKKLAFVTVGIAALAACSLDPKQYESTPVTVDTPQGQVVCQLYTKDIVSWDRSIDRPDNMSVKTADAYCLQEGQKQKAM